VSSIPDSVPVLQDAQRLGACENRVAGLQLWAMVHTKSKNKPPTKERSSAELCSA
jgi:hypothetical protein